MLKTTATLLMLFAIMFLAVSPTALAQDSKGVQDNGYLPMPEHFFGFWEAYSRSRVNVGMNILPGGIIENRRDDAVGKLEDTNFYKVFHIEDGVVYLIVRREYSAESIDQEMPHLTAEKRADILAPQWRYWRLSTKPSDIGSYTLLKYATQGCDLSEEDWDLPASTHWTRLQGKDCLGGFRATFRNRSTLARDGTD